METSFKAITNINRWRVTAIAIGSALAMSLATPAFAMGPAPTPTPAPSITSGNATGTVGVAFSYQITANQAIPNNNWGATNKPPGLTGPSNSGLISGTPTTAGTYNNVILTATNANGTGTKTVTFTINPAPTPTPSPTPHTAPTSTAAISPTAVWEGDTVTLNGTGSHTNPSGGTLDYLWQQQAPASPTLALSPSSTTNMVTFVAPTVPLPALTQAVTFRLKVTDNLASGGDKNTMSDAVTTTVYASPGADAEPKNAHVNEGTFVMLNGSATRVQPGATLSYTWTAPAGITFSDTNTQNSNAQNPTFTAPLVGIAGQALTFTLVVTEQVAGLAHAQNSAADSVTINVDNVNAPPTAQASAVDQNDPAYPKDMAEVPENTDPVTLYGFGSDPDFDAISFTWTQVHDTTGAGLLPDDTVVFLSDNTSATPTFIAPNLTTQDHVDLVFQLTTYDGHVNSGTSFVTIRVNNTNNPPVAVPAVSPLSALEGDLVTLDGSGSYDPNNTLSDPNHDTLTYTWDQTGATGAPDAPYVTLTPSGTNATFNAPAVSNAQGSITLTFNLTVDDGNGGTDTKPVSITVSHRNLPPVAIASATGTVPEGESALLDGSTSYDPEGDSVTFAWAQLDGLPVSLTPVTPDNSKMSFVAPDVGAGGGVAHFKLTVSDGHIPPSTATVEVNITYVNQPPTANAGNEQGVNEGDSVSLDGSGSDPDGNTLTFAWSQLSGPTIILSDTTDPKATFLAPQVMCAGDAVVMTLTVNDGYSGIVTSDVTINVANVNHLPTANAGGNQTNISEGGAVELHGTGGDTDGEDVTFQWTQVPQIGEPAVTLLPDSGKDVGFTAPTIGGGDPHAFVDLHFSLTVMDTCGGSTTTDPITVHVANIPHAPVAVAQGPTTANEGGDNVTLDGTGSSDPDFDALTYAWEQTAGPPVTLVYSPGDLLHKMPMFITPWVSADTDVKFKLTVSDFPGSSSSAYVTVKILNWNQPPDVTNAHADVPVLWPPDHKMIQVHILGVTDAQNNTTITINSVTQDERTNGLGDGDTPVDAVISGDSVLLRAERSGQGNGRVYKVCFTAADPEGSVNGCFNVMVPKSKKTDAAIDSGQNYDSTH
jgi:large repetitive protein